MFPTQFTGASFTWERKKLGDVAKITPGGTPSKNISNYWYPKEIPWLSSGEINKEIIFSTDDMISKEGFNNSSAKWIKQDSVLIALAGQGKTRGKVAINRIPLTTNQSIAGIEPSNEVYYKFLYHQLTKDYLKLRLVSSGDGSRGGLNKKLLNDYAVNLSSIDEQHKLGILLSRIDNTLQLHERKCEELTLIKKALLQKLFPKKEEVRPEVRYKNFSDAWEQRKLGDLGKAKSGFGFPESEQGGKECVPFFKVSDMNLKGNEFEMTTATNYVTHEQISLKKWKPIEEVPAIFFAKVGAAVLLNRKRLCRLPFLLDNNTMAFSFDVQKLDIDFTVSLFSKINLPALAQVGALPSYNTKDVESIKVYIPSLEEQKKIGVYLKKINNLIALHQRKLEKLKQLKKFLLQNMFI